MKIYLFLLPPLLSKDGGRRVVATPLPKLFSGQTFLIFFYRYMGIWTKGR